MSVTVALVTMVFAFGVLFGAILTIKLQERLIEKGLLSFSKKDNLDTQEHQVFYKSAEINSSHVSVSKSYENTDLPPVVMNFSGDNISSNIKKTKKKTKKDDNLASKIDKLEKIK